MISSMVHEVDTDDVSASIFEERFRFLWWRWNRFRWVVYHYQPAELHSYLRLEGYSDTLEQAKVAVNMGVFRK